MKRNSMNIGIVSFITVFIILCLVTFSVLTLASATSSSSLSERSVTFKKEYYALTNEGESFLQTIDETLYALYTQSESEQAYFENLGTLVTIDKNMRIEENYIFYTIEGKHQQLVIEVEVLYPGTTLYSIKNWKIRSNKEWNPDQGLNIL